jgi:phospholipid transport system substrate-binding protein
MILFSRRGVLLLAGLATIAAAPAESSPVAPVEALDQGILAIMHASKSRSFDERVGMFTPVATASFDLPLILSRSVGPAFAQYTPQTREELLKVFTEFTVASYVANFNDYSGERFEIEPALRQAGADEIVRTRLIEASGKHIKLDYVVHNEAGAWKIVDVLLDGSISRVAVQRSDFRSLVSGGDAGPLIASLRQKVARLAAGQAD